MSKSVFSQMIGDFDAIATLAKKIFSVFGICLV